MAFSNQFLERGPWLAAYLLQTDRWADAVVVAAVQTGWLYNPVYASSSRSSHIAMLGCKSAQRVKMFYRLVLGTDIQALSMTVWTCCGLWLLRHEYVGAQDSLAPSNNNKSHGLGPGACIGWLGPSGSLCNDH